jgi:hypothetical protein
MGVYRKSLGDVTVIITVGESGYNTIFQAQSGTIGVPTRVLIAALEPDVELEVSGVDLWREGSRLKIQDGLILLVFEAEEIRSFLERASVL